MTNDMILELYRRHDYTTLEEDGFLTPGYVAYAFKMGAISRIEAEKLSSWFY